MGDQGPKPWVLLLKGRGLEFLGMLLDTAFVVFFSASVWIQEYFRRRLVDNEFLAGILFVGSIGIGATLVLPKVIHIADRLLIKIGISAHNIWHAFRYGTHRTLGEQTDDNATD